MSTSLASQKKVFAAYRLVTEAKELTPEAIQKKLDSIAKEFGHGVKVCTNLDSESSSKVLQICVDDETVGSVKQAKAFISGLQKQIAAVEKAIEYVDDKGDIASDLFSKLQK